MHLCVVCVCVIFYILYFIFIVHSECRCNSNTAHDTVGSRKTMRNGFLLSTPYQIAFNLKKKFYHGHELKIARSYDTTRENNEQYLGKNK